MERLGRQPKEAELLIDLAETTDLQEIRFTTDEGYDLRTANGIYRARGDANRGERESRKISGTAGISYPCAPGPSDARTRGRLQRSIATEEALLATLTRA